MLTSWPTILGDIKAVLETGNASFGSRTRNWLMKTLDFMAPRATLIDNIDELKGPRA